MARPARPLVGPGRRMALAAGARTLLGLTVLALGLLLAPTRARPDEGARAKPSPPATDLEVPVGAPVQLDGLMPPGEWERAVRRPLGADGATLAVMQFRGTLFLGIDVRGPWPVGSKVWFLFAPDREGSGGYREGAVRVDFEPFEHNRPHLMVRRVGELGEDAVEGLAVARSQAHGTRTAVEVAIRLELLGLARPDAPPVRFAVVWARGPGEPPLLWPPHLTTAGEPGAPPPDLATSARWGRLRGWVQAGGPGAYPPDAWEEMLAFDRELTRRGMEAHGVGMDVAEEPNLPKVDAEQVPALVENLRWIARHEPLSAYDLLVLASGYAFLNRRPEALALLDALASHPAWRASERLLHERGRLLESMQRYEEAAQAWEQVAQVAAPGMGSRYVALAARARDRALAWAAEEAAREEDRRDPHLPLVLLRTQRGDVLVQLFARDVPQAARHFLALATPGEDGATVYDRTLFHRVIGNFLAQGGDPATRTAGCDVPGRTVGERTVPVETNARHGFWRGAVGFARSVEPVNGSQFFLLVAPRPDLDEQGFTCLGWVVSGLDVVDRLERCDLLEAVVVLHPGDLAATPPQPPDAPDTPHLPEEREEAPR